MFKIIQHNSEFLQADIITINAQFLLKVFGFARKQKSITFAQEKRGQSRKIESEWTQILYLAKISKQLLKTIFKKRKST